MDCTHTLLQTLNFLVLIGLLVGLVWFLVRRAVGAVRG